MKDILFILNPKKELKREVITKKIDDYILKIDNVNLNDLDLIKYIEKENYLHKYKSNKDYQLIGRKKVLMNELETILNEYDDKKYVFSKIKEMIRVLLQFITEGSKIYPEDVEKSKWINGKRIDNRDYFQLRQMADRYTLNGIICLEEKEDILSMIEKIKKDLNK